MKVGRIKDPLYKDYYLETSHLPSPPPFEDSNVGVGGLLRVSLFYSLLSQSWNLRPEKGQLKVRPTYDLRTTYRSPDDLGRDSF